MISRIWWINFILSAASLVVIILTIGVLRQNPAIPSQTDIKTSDKWPEVSGVIIGRKMNESDFAVVTEKNPFSADRTFADVKKEEKEVEVAQETDEPKEIEEGTLDLFATFFGGSINYAIVSNPGIPEITKTQIRVKKGDKLGDYLIEKIEPHRIIVVKNNDSFEVKLRKSKSVDKKSEAKDEKKSKAQAGKTPSDGTSAKKIKTISDSPSKAQAGDKGGSKTTEKSTSISPKDTAQDSQSNPDNQQKPDGKGKNLVTEGGETYEIMKTPFGTIKRKVK